MRWWPLLVVLAGCDLVFEINTQGPPGEITFIQQNANQTLQSTVNETGFLVDTFAGDLMIVGVDWVADGAVSSIVTSCGVELIPVGDPVSNGALHAQMFYGADIPGGPCAVTVELTAVVDDIEMYVTEYAGIATSDPLDAAAANASGSPGAMSSGGARLTSAGDLIFAYAVDGHVDPGDGFTTRSTYHENLTQDMIAAVPGLYIATATATSGWTIVMGAFRAAPKS